MKKKFTKKEMQQLAVVALLVGGGIVYGFWVLFITPLKETAKTRAVKLDALATQNRQAHAAISAVREHEEKLATMNLELRQLTEQHAVRPILGSSYQLGMRQRFDPLAAKTKFTIQSINALQPEPLPWGRPDAPLSLCVADIRGIGSYQQIRDFVATVESENPLIHLSSLTISADLGNDPTRHRAAFRFDCISAPAQLEGL